MTEITIPQRISIGSRRICARVKVRKANNKVAPMEVLLNGLKDRT